MILKDMEFQDGFLTESEIIKKAKIFKWLLMFLKLSSEKIFSAYSKLELIEVLDINGDLKLEDNIQKLPGVEVEQLV